jgi:hypothetical protein
LETPPYVDVWIIAQIAQNANGYFYGAAPRNRVVGVLRKIIAITALQKLEIHKVFLRFCALF